jgi:malonyl-CoA O-methyltransferase
MMQLPFRSGAFDLVFANQVIHWSTPLDVVIRELNRILIPGGCLMFSTLGPDTFLELRAAFRAVDAYGHVNDFLDMHDVGDCLLREQFQDPVVDMEVLTAHYNTLSALLQGLKAQGVRNINRTRNPGLTGKHLWSRFTQKVTEFITTEGKFPLTYEVVYGHAWKGMKQKTAQGTDTYISVEQLKSSLRKR